MLAAALVLMLFGSPATFADPSFDCDLTDLSKAEAEKAQCLAAATSQVEMSQCWATAQDSVDKTLAATVQVVTKRAQKYDEDMTVMGSVLGNTTIALEQSQAAWAAYRDAQCSYVATTYGGGSGTGIAVSACRVNLTRERVRQLLDRAGLSWLCQ